MKEVRKMSKDEKILVTLLGVIFLIILIISYGSAYTSGGNEILSTSCSSSGDLTILVGKFNGERELVNTEIKCESVDK